MKLRGLVKGALPPLELLLHQADKPFVQQLFRNISIPTKVKGIYLFATIRAQPSTTM